MKTDASDEERTVGLAGRFLVVLVEAEPKARGRVARLRASDARWPANSVAYSTHSAACGSAALVAAWFTPKALILLVRHTAPFVAA